MVYLSEIDNSSQKIEHSNFQAEMRIEKGGYRCNEERETEYEIGISEVRRIEGK